MGIKRHIPNSITLGNLLCGCLAIVKAFEGDLVWTAYLVGMALILDFFDGFAARMLKVSSAIGKDLDSLADMVTFGVVPGVVMFQMINHSLSDTVIPEPGLIWAHFKTVYPLSYFAFVICVFSGLRLAKFNNDKRQTDSFIGLPTPANAMVICCFPLISTFQPELTLINELIHNVEFLLVLTFLLSALLIAEIPLFSLKFKSFGWNENKLVYLFLLLSIVLLFSLKYVAIALIIIFYILVSIVNNIFLKKKV